MPFHSILQIGRLFCAMLSWCKFHLGLLHDLQYPQKFYMSIILFKIIHMNSISVISLKIASAASDIETTAMTATFQGQCRLILLFIMTFGSTTKSCGGVWPSPVLRCFLIGYTFRKNCHR